MASTYLMHLLCTFFHSDINNILTTVAWKHIIHLQSVTQIKYTVVVSSSSNFQWKQPHIITQRSPMRTKANTNHYLFFLFLPIFLLWWRFFCHHPSQFVFSLLFFYGEQGLLLFCFGFVLRHFTPRLDQLLKNKNQASFKSFKNKKKSTILGKTPDPQFLCLGLYRMSYQHIDRSSAGISPASANWSIIRGLNATL